MSLSLGPVEETGGARRLGGAKLNMFACEETDTRLPRFEMSRNRECPLRSISDFELIEFLLLGGPRRLVCGAPGLFVLFTTLLRVELGEKKKLFLAEDARARKPFRFEKFEELFESGKEEASVCTEPMKELWLRLLPAQTDEGYWRSMLVVLGVEEKSSSPPTQY